MDKYGDNILLNIKKSSMDLKKNEGVSTPNMAELQLSRYKASRGVFIFSTFVFFLNYFLLAAHFYDTIFAKTLPFSYTIFLTGFMIYLYFFLGKVFALPKGIQFWLGIVLVIVGIIFLLPFSGMSVSNF